VSSDRGRLGAVASRLGPASDGIGLVGDGKQQNEHQTLHVEQVGSYILASNIKGSDER
jgi:hypothetical protein